MTFLYVYLSEVVGQKSVYDLHSSHWHFQKHWTIEMLMGTFKFGELISGTSAVNAAQLCTAGINHDSG